MRRREIDWLRNLAILMLFFYHTSVVFQVWGDNYVKSSETSYALSLFLVVTEYWYMQLLFFLAGASAYFSIKMRGTSSFVNERVKKLLIPFVFGLIVIVPPQGYLARLWRGDVPSNYFIFLKEFFTDFSDITGNHGTFTPAQLWFILFLFLISLIFLPILRFFSKENGMVFLEKSKKILLSSKIFLILSIILFLCELFPAPGGKNLLQFLVLFVLGYMVYSDEYYLNILDKVKGRFLIFTIVLLPTYVILLLNIRYFITGLTADIIMVIIKNLLLIITLVCIVGYGRKYLNKESRILKYLNKASFPVYILHQTVLITVAYFIVPLSLTLVFKVILIIALTIIFTFGLYEIIKRIKGIRFFLGIK